MVKPKINYWIDIIMFVGFLITAVTGVVLFFMPKGPRSSLSSFLGIIKHTWGEIHNGVGIGLIIVVLIHFILHWNWFVCMTRNIFKKKKN